MRLERSDLDGIYGVVTLPEDIKVQVLFGEGNDKRGPGITVVRGGASTYDYFVFVPVEIFDQLIELHSLSVFDQALMRVCQLLIPHDEDDDD